LRYLIVIELFVVDTYLKAISYYRISHSFNKDENLGLQNIKTAIIWGDA